MVMVVWRQEEAGGYCGVDGGHDGDGDVERVRGR